MPSPNFNKNNTSGSVISGAAPRVIRATTIEFGGSETTDAQTSQFYNIVPVCCLGLPEKQTIKIPIVLLCNFLFQTIHIHQTRPWEKPSMANAGYRLMTIHVGFIATAGTVSARSPGRHAQNSEEGSLYMPK